MNLPISTCRYNSKIKSIVHATMQRIFMTRRDTRKLYFLSESARGGDYFCRGSAEIIEDAK